MKTQKEIEENCRACNGSGEIDGETCLKCGGYGKQYIQKENEIEKEIPNVVSFGAGQNSTAMVILMKNKGIKIDDIVFAENNTLTYKLMLKHELCHQSQHQRGDNRSLFWREMECYVKQWWGLWENI